MTTQRRKKPTIASPPVVELDEREKQIQKDYQWVLHDRTIQRQQAGNVVAVPLGPGTVTVVGTPRSTTP